MHIDDLMKMIEEDVGGELRRDLVDWEASRTQKLHQKYRRILYFEKLELERMKSGILPLIRLKKEYYSGKAPEEVYKEKPFPIRLETIGNNRIIKEDMNLYIDSDPDVIAAKELVVQQTEKVEYLKDTLEDIRRRSYHLSNITNYLRFKHGLDNLNQILELVDPQNEGDD